MQLVISIVSWNTRDLLRACLDSLRRHDSSGESRIIVVDNASSDGTPAMLKADYPEVTLIESGANIGFGRAHNLAITQSVEPFVLFLNPDTEFVSDAHMQMLDVFKQPDIGAVGCRMCNQDGTDQPMCFQWNMTPWTECVEGLLVSRRMLRLAQKILPSHDARADGDVRKLNGGCLMVRRAALDEVGGFDERFFMYAEDVDLSRRLVTGGWRLYHLGTTAVIHLCGGASVKAPGRFAVLMRCQSRAALMEKNYGVTGRRLYVAIIFVRSLSRLLLIAPWCGLVRLIHRRPDEALEASRRGLISTLNWSLGRERPLIPSSRI